MSPVLAFYWFWTFGCLLSKMEALQKAMRMILISVLKGNVKSNGDWNSHWQRQTEWLPSNLNRIHESHTVQHTCRGQDSTVQYQEEPRKHFHYQKQKSEHSSPKRKAGPRAQTTRENQVFCDKSLPKNRAGNDACEHSGTYEKFTVTESCPTRRGRNGIIAAKKKKYIRNVNILH